jgi:hypothetical protein
MLSAAREDDPVPDDTVSTRGSHDVLAELDQARQSAARLLENLAERIGAAPAVRSAAGSVHRAAHYVHAHSVKDVVTGIERAARRRPIHAIAIAVAAGFLVGRAIRSRSFGG